MAYRLKDGVYSVRCRHPGCNFDTQIKVETNLVGVTEKDVEQEAMKIARDMANTKHHALVLRDRPRDDGAYPAPRHDVGVPRPPVSEPVPVVEDYTGAATVLTLTVGFDREGAPERGAVICAGARGERVAAAVHDRDTLELLTDGTEPVGREGSVTLGAVPEFTL